MVIRERVMRRPIVEEGDTEEGDGKVEVGGR